MFCTFRESNLESPLETRTVEIGPPRADEYAADTREFVGVSARSRYGCLTCRKKKKKCDEQRPTCGLCAKQGHVCHWKPPGTERKNTRRLTRQAQAPAPAPAPQQHGSPQPLEAAGEPLKLESAALLRSPFLNAVLNPANPASPSGSESQDVVVVAGHAKRSLEEDFNLSVGTPMFDFLDLLKYNESPPVPQTIHAGITKGLDEQAIRYLDYYQNCVATTVSIVPTESNYFLKFYLPMAAEEKSVLYGIIGWGGTFMTGSKDTVAYSYYTKKSVELYREKLAQKELTKNDILVLLTTLSILSASEICLGDVKNWYVFFDEIYQIIKRYGLKNLLKDFGHSNELRWLTLCFLYHDVLSSTSLKNGTCFKSIEYQQALQQDASELMAPDDIILKLTEQDYGADPLQGCVKPLYMIICEMINVSVELKNERTALAELELKCAEKLASLDSFRITDYDLISLKERQVELNARVESEFERLEEKINQTKPNDIALSYLNDDKELELHLTLFESYQLTAFTYLRMLVLHEPPVSSTMQRLSYNAINCIDILIGSPVQSSLCFPLMIAGLQCVTALDRQLMAKRFQYMTEHFPVMNFQKTKQILEEAWRINPDGEKCIDWSTITDRFGWDLCVS